MTNWEKEKKIMENSFSMLVGRNTSIIDIINSDEIGFTSKDGKIHLAKTHEIFKDLKEDMKKVFRFGVFSHEMLHQIYSNFDALEQYLDSFDDKYERNIAASITNILEDPAIEYFAPQAFSGYLLKSLKFTINHIYNQTSVLENCKTAYTQFVCALIQFGDMGYLKGHFTFPEAKEVFSKVAHIFYEGTREPDAKKRLLVADKIKELSKPLWEKDTKQEKREELQALDNEMKQSGKSEMSGSGSGQSGQPDKKNQSNSEIGSDSEKNEKEKRQEKTMSRVCDNINADKKNKENQEKKIHEKLDSNNQNASPDFDGLFDGMIPLEKEFELTEDDKKEFQKLLETVKKNEKKNQLQTASEYDFNARSPFYDFSKVRVENVDKFKSSLDKYDTEKQIIEKDIRVLTNQLKRIFMEDRELKEYRNSGKVSVNRVYGGRVTSRLFERKISPSEKADVVVGIQIDESGSMCDKTNETCLMAILLAETFAKLNIPIYIMGYTDTGSKVIHHHYLKWNNSPNNRLNLSSISSYCRNFDGYSIRTMTSILKKKPAKHKLHIVITDGMPTGYLYNNQNDGVADTKDAIFEAKKQSNVIGVLLGNQDVEVIHQMYGNDFLHVDDAFQLSMLLIRQIKAILKGW